MHARMIPLLLLMLTFGACQVAPVPDPDLDWVNDPSRPRPAPPPPPGAHDQELALLPLTPESARRTVVEATVWAPYGIGIAPSDRRGQLETLAFLLRQPHAGELLEEMYERAGTPGRLLALCALRRVHDDRFARLSAPLVGSRERVGTCYGCICETEAAGDILAGITTGDVCR